MKSVQKSAVPRRTSRPSAPASDLVPDEARVLATLGLGGRIALARQNKGWTQKELSERLGKSRGTVIQYEQGRIEPPLRQIEAMAQLLHVAPELLAFGRQGIAGLSGDTADVASVPEVKVMESEESVTGAYGLPDTLVTDLGIDPARAKIFVLQHAASAFGLAAGDRIIVNTGAKLDQEDALYALHTRRGLDVVRLLPNLSTRDEAVKINDGSGETRSYEQDELNVLGHVVGSIRAG
jgi:transcriptional regulator with XRE-family HTH domain